MSQTTIDITVSENLSAAIDRALVLGDDLSAPMGEISRAMVASAQFNFLNSKSPLGVPWKKRIPHPGKVDFAHPILRKSGDLFASLREDFGPSHAAAGPENSGGAAIYARIHQLGGTIRPTRAKFLNTPFGPKKSVMMPARPYLGWNDALEARSISILGDHLKAAFAGGGVGAASGGAL